MLEGGLSPRNRQCLKKPDRKSNILRIWLFFPFCNVINYLFVPSDKPAGLVTASSLTAQFFLFCLFAGFLVSVSASAISAMGISIPLASLTGSLASFRQPPQHPTPCGFGCSLSLPDNCSFEIHYGIMVQSLFRHLVAWGLALIHPTIHPCHKYFHFVFADSTYSVPFPITWSSSWPAFSIICFHRNVIHTAVSVNFYSWTAASLLQGLWLSFYSLENSNALILRFVARIL